MYLRNKRSNETQNHRASMVRCIRKIFEATEFFRPASRQAFAGLRAIDGRRKYDCNGSN